MTEKELYEYVRYEQTYVFLSKEERKRYTVLYNKFYSTSYYKKQVYTKLYKKGLREKEIFDMTLEERYTYVHLFC